MTDLFANHMPPDPMYNLLPYDGVVNDFGVFIDSKASQDLYEDLLRTLPWQRDEVTLFGKTHVLERQVVWMGDAQIAYRYSGHTRQSTIWDDRVFHVKQLIEDALQQVDVKCRFNSCLLNYYPSGAQGMGFHADNEQELGTRPVIASISLGATRKFVLKHNRTKDKVEIPLSSGQLLVMHKDTQTHWKHCITKTKKVDTGRINLTFRQMVNL